MSTAAIPAIIALSRLPEPMTRMRCAATLCKLASVEANVPLMVAEGVVPAFIEMLKTQDQEIVKHCCAALCHLAHEGESSVVPTPPPSLPAALFTPDRTPVNKKTYSVPSAASSPPTPDSGW